MLNILISSYITYCDKTLPPLLSSLSASGVPKENISVVIGGATNSFSSSYNTVPFNAYDMTALIWQSHQKVIPDYCFLLPDTCTVGLNFWNTIKNTNEVKSLMPQGSLNIGCYSGELIEAYKAHLCIYKDCSKWKIIKDGDLLFREHNNLKWFCEQRIEQGMVDFYNTGNKRLKLYYPEIELTKYQANFYGQTELISTL